MAISQHVIFGFIRGSQKTSVGTLPFFFFFLLDGKTIYSNEKNVLFLYQRRITVQQLFVINNFHKITAHIFLQSLFVNTSTENIFDYKNIHNCINFSFEYTYRDLRLKQFKYLLYSNNSKLLVNTILFYH